MDLPEKCLVFSNMFLVNVFSPSEIRINIKLSNFLNLLVNSAMHSFNHFFANVQNICNLIGQKEYNQYCILGFNIALINLKNNIRFPWRGKIN